MTDRVNLDELRHDEDEMRQAERYKEAEREAERWIGNVDNSDDILHAWEQAGSELRIAFMEKLRARDPSVVGFLPILKQFYMTELARLSWPERMNNDSYNAE